MVPGPSFRNSKVPGPLPRYFKRPGPAVPMTKPSPKINGPSFQALNPLTLSNLPEFLSAQRIFAEGVREIGRIKGESHNIRLKPGTAPIQLRPYRYSDVKRKEIGRQVAELLELGLIRPSHSPWAAPVTLAPKSDGTARLCIDYRKLNEETISFRHPIPLIQDLLDSVGQSTFFSTLDAVCGYWHVKLDEESIERSAFVTHEGHFEWLVMPFGLKNAPATFQRIMQRILSPFIGKGVDVYLDDIVVHTKTQGDHGPLLAQVLETLETEGLRLKRKKCHFFQTEITYLGHLITAGEVRPLPQKVEAITKFPAPTKVKELQSFVGLANYYRDFVPNMSRIVSPLTKLTKKDVPFIWTTETQAAFDKIKVILTSAPVLSVYSPDCPNELTTDASAQGLAAVYTQVHPDNKHRVVAYWSRRTIDAETRYSAVELEVLAVLEALEHFRHYLEGTDVTVITDCAAIRWIRSNKDTSSRLFRWTLRLSTFTFTVHHRAGTSNVVADALSRNLPEVNLIGIGTVPMGAITARQHELRNYSITLPTRLLRGALNVLLNGRNRIVVPKSLVPEVLKTAHDERNHCGTNTTRFLVTRGYWWPNMSKDITDYVRSCHPCQLVKPPNGPEVGTCQPVECPESPNDIWSIDTVVLGSPANNCSAKYAQVIVDHHSRFVWTFPTKTNTTEMVISCLSQIINCVGAPRVLISDNATNFVSQRMEKFLERHKVEHRRISAYHPRANGLNERTHFTIIQAIRLRMISDDKRYKWSTLARLATKEYNSLPHSVTGFAPVYLHFGHRPDRNPDPEMSLEQARHQAVRRTQEQQQKRKERFDSSHVPSNFEVGSLVLHKLPSTHPDRNKLSPIFEGPYTVTARNGLDSYELTRSEYERRPEIRAHASSLKHYFNRPQHLLLQSSSAHDLRFQAPGE